MWISSIATVIHMNLCMDHFPTVTRDCVGSNWTDHIQVDTTHVRALEIIPEHRSYLALFPGYHVPECKYWSCAGWYFVSSRLRTEKRAKIVGNLLHYLATGGRITYTPSVELIVGWTTRKKLPFCFSPISITSCLQRKDTRLFPQIHIHVPGELGN